MLQGNRIRWSYAVLAKCDSVSRNAVIYKNVSLLFITLDYGCWIVCGCTVIYPVNCNGLKCFTCCLINILHRCCFLIWCIRNRLNIVWCAFSNIINRRWFCCIRRISSNCWWFNCWKIISWTCICPRGIRNYSRYFILCCCPTKGNWSCGIWFRSLAITIYIMNRLRYRMLQVKSIRIWRCKCFRSFFQMNLIILNNSILTKDCSASWVIITY